MQDDVTTRNASPSVGEAFFVCERFETFRYHSAPDFAPGCWRASSLCSLLAQNQHLASADSALPQHQLSYPSNRTQRAEENAGPELEASPVNNSVVVSLLLLLPIGRYRWGLLSPRLPPSNSPLETIGIPTVFGDS